LLPLIGPADHLVAAIAGPDGRNTGIDRSLGREVAVLAVDQVHTGVNRVWKRDWLDPLAVSVGEYLSRTTVLCV
jgi:hypothetical protein